MRTSLNLRSMHKVFATLLLAAAVAATLTVSASARPARVARAQRLAVVLTAHAARSAPDLHASVVQVVASTTPLTHERTVLPVLGKARGRQGATWLRVRLPGRPNGHAGWIKEQGTRQARTSWSILVDLRDRHVTVYRSAVPMKSFPVVIGRPSAPTPAGWFYVEESLRITPGYAGGPYALALSARSNVYSEFDGGPGQIAFHGVYGIGGTPGTAVSHGCVRVGSADMAWLGEHIKQGVPVRIVA
jgi:lipoprotein-anchoring transpeptidase ErfK/SrfK